MIIENFLSIAAYLGALLLLTPILGNYMAKVLSGQRVFLSAILGPCERLIYRLCFIDPDEEMHWKRYTNAVLWFSVIGVIAVFFLQVMQSQLPFNPQSLAAVPWALALNTAVSFVTNTQIGKHIQARTRLAI